MDSQIFEIFEEEVKFFKGEIVRNCGSEEELIAYNIKSKSSCNYGYYYYEDNIGVYFTGEKSHVIGIWDKLGEKPNENGKLENNEELIQYKNKFQLVELKDMGETGFCLCES